MSEKERKRVRKKERERERERASYGDPWVLECLLWRDAAIGI